jgi:hypothetical protein
MLAVGWVIGRVEVQKDALAGGRHLCPALARRVRRGPGRCAGFGIGAFSSREIVGWLARSKGLLGRRSKTALSKGSEPFWSSYPAASWLSRCLSSMSREWCNRGAAPLGDVAGDLLARPEPLVGLRQHTSPPSEVMRPCRRRPQGERRTSAVLWRLTSSPVEALLPKRAI